MALLNSINSYRMVSFSQKLAGLNVIKRGSAMLKLSTLIVVT